MLARTSLCYEPSQTLRDTTLDTPFSYIVGTAIASIWLSTCISFHNPFRHLIPQ